jgi:hypothetical protein
VRKLSRDGVSQGKAAASIDANNNYTSITFKADEFFIFQKMKLDLT